MNNELEFYYIFLLLQQKNSLFYQKFTFFKGKFQIYLF